MDVFTSPAEEEVRERSRRKRKRGFLLAFRASRTFMTTAPVLVLLWQINGLSQTGVSLLQVWVGVIMFVFLGPTGQIADRVGYRSSLMIGAAFMTVCYILYTVIVLGWQGVGPIFLAESMRALGVACIDGKQSALGYSLLDTQDTAQNAAFEGKAHRLEALSQACASLAPAGFILLHQGAGPAIPWLELCIIQLIVVGGVMLPLATALKESGVRRKPRGGPITEMVAALRVLREKPHILGHILYAAVVITLIYNSVWLVQPYLQWVGVPTWSYGPIWSGLMLTWSLSTYVIKWYCHKSRLRWTIPLMLAIGVSSFALCGLSRSWLGVIALMGFQFIRAITKPLVVSAINEEIDETQRASVQSAQDAVQCAFFIPVMILTGILWDATGPAVTMLVQAVFYGIVGGVVCVWLSRHLPPSPVS